ncbi:hypothetical protein ACJX0J_036532, partial [Zea mays]
EWKRHIIYHFQAILCCMLCSLKTINKYKEDGQYLHAHCFTQYPILVFLSMPLVVIFHYKDRYMQVWLNAMFSEIRDFTISYPNLFLMICPILFILMYRSICYDFALINVHFSNDYFGLFTLFEKEDKKGMFGVYFFMHACTMGISPILQVPGVPIIYLNMFREKKNSFHVTENEKNRTKNVEWKRHIIYHFQAILCCMLCSLFQGKFSYPIVVLLFRELSIEFIATCRTYEVNTIPYLFEVLYHDDSHYGTFSDGEYLHIKPKN